jgi:hypothetical protein
MKENTRGFSYNLQREQIEEYSRWPIEKRLAWLHEANRLRRLLSPRIQKIQEGFRQGKR